MTTIQTKVVGGVTQLHEISDQPLTLLVHQQGIRVNVPEATLELDARRTIDYIQKLDQVNWKFASTSPIFKLLFETCFPPNNSKNFGSVTIPKDIDELKESDFGVQHVCGMIIMCVDTVLHAQDKGQKVKIFLREPETHLHPATQRNVIDMLHILQGGAPNGNTETEASPEEAI